MRIDIDWSRLGDMKLADPNSPEVKGDSTFWSNYYAPHQSAWDLSLSRNPLYTALTGIAILGDAVGIGYAASGGGAVAAGTSATGTSAAGTIGASTAGTAAAGSAATAATTAAAAADSPSIWSTLWSGFKDVAGAAAQYGPAAYSIWSSEQQKKEETKINTQMADAISQELTKFPGMITDVNKMYGQRLNILGTQRGSAIYDLLQKHTASEAKSGFAGSGALDQQMRVETSSVYDLFAGKQFELLSQKQSQLSELEAQARALRVQRASLTG
jgi:hypothetical protein